MKNVLKIISSIAISLILLFPACMITMLSVFILDSITNSLFLSYLIPCAVFGTIAAIPVIVTIYKNKTQANIIKCILTALSIIIFSTILFIGTQL